MIYHDEWSIKQWQMLNLHLSPYRLHILIGAIRSGKTLPGTHGFVRNACMNHADEDFGLAARSRKQYVSVVDRNIRQYVNSRNMAWRLTADHYTLPSWKEPGATNRFWPLLASDAQSADRVQGMTLSGVYADEAPLMPEYFVSVLRDRCSSVDNAKIVLTGNPEGPHHWFKTNWIDKLSSRGVYLQFGLKDNPSLSESAIREIVETYPSGALFRRRVLGEWAASEGLIWPMYADAIAEPPLDKKPWCYDIVVDFAPSARTHALLIAHYDDCCFVVDEWVHHGQLHGDMLSTDQAITIFNRFVSYDTNVNINSWIIDPAAHEFHTAVYSVIPHATVVHANNEVMEGIQYITELMRDKLIYVSRNCPQLIAQMANYMWDELALQRGEDKPVRVNCDGCDALRYFGLTTGLAWEETGVRHYRVAS